MTARTRSSRPSTATRSRSAKRTARLELGIETLAVQDEGDEVHRVNVNVNALLRARRELPDLEWVKVMPRLAQPAA